MTKSKTYIEQFLEYFKDKISYKVLRMEIINELHPTSKTKIKINEHKSSNLQMTFMEQNFLFFVLNSGIANIYLNRKSGSLLYLFGTTTLVCSYTFLAFMFYGEERIFYRNSLRSDETGFYLRKKYIINNHIIFSLNPILFKVHFNVSKPSIC